MKYLFFTFFCFTMTSAQYGLEKLGSNPVTYIDSVKAGKPEMLALHSNLVTLMTVYNPTEAKNLVGEEGKDGAVYVETRGFSKKRFLRYFKSKSKEFSKLLDSKGDDSTFQYILNGKILTNNFEGELALVDDKVFKKIDIIKQKELSAKYSIKDKDYGIIITSTIPEDSSKK